MRVDYHMHPRAPRADGVEELDHTVEAVARYVDVARDRGLDEIGFSEHVYYFEQTSALWEVPYHRERCVYDIEPYVEAVLEAKRRGLPVKLGLEVDYVRTREDETRELLGAYPWDYLLGSVHYIGRLGVDAEPRLIDDVGVERAWERYFEELAAAATSGLFDSLAHPDLVKLWGIRPDAATVARVHEHFIGAAQDSRTALEVSSAGLHKPVGEMYPDGALLALARDAGMTITLASDAHDPRHVGRDVDAAVAHARAAGYETVTVFELRTGRQEALT